MIINGLNLKCRDGKDEDVCREVIQKQTYERRRLGFCVYPGSRWLDIGANIGAFSVWAGSKRAKELLAFEPCRQNYEQSVVNIEINRSPAQCFREAVGSKKGTCRIAYNKRTPARSSSLGGSGEAEEVPMRGFNDIVEEFRPDGIKLDAEGAELEILDRGMMLKGVNFLVMEYHARFDKDCQRARSRIEPLRDQFNYHRIPKMILDKDQYDHWVDPICFFWN